MITWTIIFVSCTHPSAPASTESPDKVATTPTDTFLTLKGKKTTPKKTSKSATSEKPLSHKPIVLTSGTYDSKSLTEDSLKMEAIYQDMLAPIASLKTSDPKTYWFIVSWLNTAYRTPNWRNYSNYPAWRLKTKKKGLDCSGFTRVMQDRIFGRRVRGGSQGILKTQCKPVKRSDLIKGDLVFFRAPHAKNDRIVHMGVYLMDGFFVHATSKKSASDGKGLMISSLDEVNWAAEYVTGGQIIEK
ncbi:MAG: C40 family peptidase [Saprospiraceae bacterium]|nr:C40 family peptidase [Saprospiraceae bacterium]